MVHTAVQAFALFGISHTLDIVHKLSTYDLHIAVLMRWTALGSDRVRELHLLVVEHKL